MTLNLVLSIIHTVSFADGHNSQTKNERVFVYLFGLQTSYAKWGIVEIA